MALNDKDAPQQPTEPEKPIAEVLPVVWSALGLVLTALAPLTWRQADSVLNAARELIADKRPKGESTW